MKNSLLKTAHLGISLVCSLLFLFTPVTSGQTSCDAWDYGLTGGGISGTVAARLDTYCNSSPQDTVRTAADGLVITTHNIYTRGTSGGTATCTNYPKQIVITFSRPVADFFAGVWGARKVTASTGQTLTFNPGVQSEGDPIPGYPLGGGTIYFEGGGITSITISDPFEYDVAGYQSAWECGMPTLAKLAPQ
ncbi:MAG: hypothetical protein LC775_16690 [Acidobacteria bacterium]|nr:hypothetical protein [Acidobacteriota bacterium]